MTCAKAFVSAELTAVTGEVFSGTNFCHRPQKQCPREAGDGYDKCLSICMQDGHAEQMAVKYCIRAGVDPTGGQMKVKHKRVCDGCQKLMKAYGITWKII
jgi:hypothetical protein